MISFGLSLLYSFNVFCKWNELDLIFSRQSFIQENKYRNRKDISPREVGGKFINFTQHSITISLGHFLLVHLVIFVMDWMSRYVLSLGTVY